MGGSRDRRWGGSSSGGRRWGEGEGLKLLFKHYRALIPIRISTIGKI